MSEKEEKQAVDWLARLGKSAKIPFGMLDMILASFFINLLSLAMPLALLQIYDRIIPNTSMNTLTMLIAGIGIALILEGLLRIGRSYLSGWVGARFEHMAGCAAVERILSTSVNDFEREGSGVHLERMDSLGTLKEFYAGQAIMTLFDLPFAFIFLMAISYLAGNLVFVPICLIIMFAVTAVHIGHKLRKALSERMVADERRFNFIIEVLTGIHTLKSMAMEMQMLRRYERLQEACAKTDYEVTRQSSSAMGLGAIYSQVTMFMIVGFGSTFVIDGELTVGGLAACTMLSGRAMQPLQRAVGIWARFQSIQLARDKMREIFKLQPETEGGLPVVRGDYTGSIEVKDVGLHFGDEEKYLFDNVSFKVEPGQIVGISGGNASGKSSLLYLMMGAMRASKGEILIDGENINELDPASVRRKIAYLPQHGVLFNGTILENLTMFKPELEEKALRIARLLGLDEVVARMPLGYETSVGNGAYDSIPRGIKQRIAIGRALMSDPVVLLFDEANSAMDSAGDKVLTQFLEEARGKRTLILVSHRPSLLRMADVVYDLTDGVFEERVMEPFKPAPPPAAGPAQQVGQQPRGPQPSQGGAGGQAPMQQRPQQPQPGQQPQQTPQGQSQQPQRPQGVQQPQAPQPAPAQPRPQPQQNQVQQPQGQHRSQSAQPQQPRAAQPTPPRPAQPVMDKPARHAAPQEPKPQALKPSASEPVSAKPQPPKVVRDQKPAREEEKPSRFVLKQRNKETKATVGGKPEAKKPAAAKKVDAKMAKSAVEKTEKPVQKEKQKSKIQIIPPSNPSPNEQSQPKFTLKKSSADNDQTKGKPATVLSPKNKDDLGKD